MRFIKFALHKRYFDVGFATLNYAKYLLMVLGINFPSIKFLILLGFGYGFLCYFLGWWWLNYGMLDAETEISNRYNLFVRQMRHKIKKRKV